MQSPMDFGLAVVLAVGLLAAGIFLVRNPERVYRRFSFGLDQNRFGMKFFRAVGWFYICGGAIGLLMLIVAAVLNHSHSH